MCPSSTVGVFIFWAFNWQISDQALLYASATLVAILPEAAIVLITVTMAISVKRMAASNAIVRKMTALEQLGKVTDICSDKTGTLTEGRSWSASDTCPSTCHICVCDLIQRERRALIVSQPCPDLYL